MEVLIDILFKYHRADLLISIIPLVIFIAVEKRNIQIGYIKVPKTHGLFLSSSVGDIFTANLIIPLEFTDRKYSFILLASCCHVCIPLNCMNEKHQLGTDTNI